jgi:hypothetical protein
LILDSPAIAQDEDGPFVKPRAEHKVLNAYEGTWDATIKIYLGGPSEPPLVLKGVETNRMLAGQRWLTTSLDGDFGGQKFEWKGMSGFDINKKLYVLDFVDSFADEMISFTGKYDLQKRTMTYQGRIVEQATGWRATLRRVITIRPDGSRISTDYLKRDRDQDEIKIQEIIYKKRQAPEIGTKPRAKADLPSKAIKRLDNRVAESCRTGLSRSS